MTFLPVFSSIYLVGRVNDSSKGTGPRDYNHRHEEYKGVHEEYKGVQ